ncbi:hypothetical protein SAMN05421771_3289 [Granulicella pectinivorans]|uniref:Uncharacterized protein n=1 Tax=Granulicella pectinivorans TaxID=474950 RepID=A0A1I6MQU0_9BACT|nr:hypothetical protein [Granulicella pectinivorans]SFS17908.1 hypothetical protein SAMN05421771_3289 [Granulicella pectinivorans]
MQAFSRALALSCSIVTLTTPLSILAQEVRLAPQEVVAPIGEKTSSLTQLTSPITDPSKQEWARVTVNVTPGPYGTAVVPSGSTAITNIPAAPASKLNYPSILLAISATPLRTPEGKDLSSNPDAIKNVSGDNELEWMDITFTLKGLGKDGKELTCTPGPCFQIIGLLPGTTTAAAKPQVPDTVAGGVNSAVASIAPALPAGGSVLTAAASGVKVLFDSLFPPKTTAYQYAYIDNTNGNQKFGWYFQANPIASPPTSLLGIQNGQVMLQTDPNITTIEISSIAFSNWKKDPSNFSKHFLYSTSDTKLPIASNKLDYNALQNLTTFPALISRDDVALILHTDDKTVDKLITAKTLSTTPDGKFIMASSLTKYITP